jgi:hypothetical protein
MARVLPARGEVDMRCDQCGADVPAAAKFCPECGRQFHVTDNSLASEAPTKATPISTQRHEELFRAVIGPKKLDYYLLSFRRIEGGVVCSWNWSAFLFTFFWFIYRKMWLGGFIYLILFFSLSIFSKVTESAGGSSISVLLSIGIILWPPLFANLMYFNVCKKRIKKAVESSGERKKQLDELSAKGGTNKIALWIGIFFFALVAAAILIAVFEKYSIPPPPKNLYEELGIPPLPKEPDAFEKFGITPPPKEDDFQWYQKAAEQGDASAQLNLGLMYATGQGVAKDERKAFEWYQKAAEQGDASAQFNLGLMYDAGRGVAKNRRKAFEWFQKAAEQGDAGAQNNLGVMYWYGQGVIRDREKACQLWEDSGTQGNEKAIENYNGNCSP